MEIIIPVNKRIFPVQLFVCSLIAIAISVFLFYTRTFSLDPYSPMTILIVLLIADIRMVIFLARIYVKTQFDNILRGYIKKWNTPLVISGRRVDFDMENLRDLLLSHSTSTINSHDLRDVG
jgi:hypothetical protein